jgi:uncharacterized membrane protein YtjA (UPF0391 family)
MTSCSMPEDERRREEPSGEFGIQPGAGPDRKGPFFWRTNMLYWALVFFVISIITGIFGFTGISAATGGIARLLFMVFIVVFIIFLVLGLTASATVP